ncbi:hypothetical protein [Streptomyces sp. NPDC002221]|uniref:hypothetical protein n=1 Tax=Streptomyces sp. NPDC002221 TaxID=3364639 RepID=UPI0036C9F5FA
MEPTALAPPVAYGIAHLPGGLWAQSDTPIYDALERVWLQTGREVPRLHNPGPWRQTGDHDLFRRA